MLYKDLFFGIKFKHESMCFFVTKFRFMVVCGHVKLGDAYGFPKKKTSYMNSFYSKKKKNI